MDTNIKSFVLLKYEIISQERETWHLCETYPVEARNKWARRCAEDVEYQVGKYSELKEYIRVAKAYKIEKSTVKDLEKITEIASKVGVFPTIMSAYYAYISDDKFVVYAAYYAANHDINKWNLYISWLIEELCNYESKQ